MQKPLIRFTIGGQEILREGFEILDIAFQQTKKLYPECDHCIVCNNLSEKGFEYLNKIDASFVNANELYCILEPGPEKTEWLIFPPRLREDAHEICMDNDIILFRRHPVIDMFLKGNNFFFATESFNERHYGNYADVVPEGGMNLNSGLYGMPPNFNFEKWIVNFYIKHGRREYHHANPQGIVAAMIKTQKNHRIISNNHIILSPILRYVVDEWDEILKREKTYGLHFTGINRGITIDTWLNFKCTTKNKDMLELREKWK